MTEIVSHFKIQRLYPHQQEAADAAQRYKASQWGRRGGKSRMAYRAAILGHGPKVSERLTRVPNEHGDYEFQTVTLGMPEPMWRGLIHGYDVLWIGRSIDQARQIWDEEVKPRFREAFGEGSTNETLRVATFPGGGRLFVTSQDRDAINNARGKGSRIIGVIGDEVAHWDDALSVWLEVLVPMLADNMGWAWFISTTYPGSWFNDLCEQIESGNKPDWFFSYKTALDNPRITRDAFDAMVAEYPADDPRLAQEVWAKRTAGGGGLAFPEWRPDVHILPMTWEPPPEWRWVAGLDYGYESRASFGLYACGSNDEMYRVWEYVCRGESPYDMGYTVGQRMPDFGLAEYIVHDPSMSAVTDGGANQRDEFKAGLDAALQRATVPMVGASKGPGSRVSRKSLVHQQLKYMADETGRVPSWGWPKFRSHPRCTYFNQHIGRLLRDEKRPEDIRQSPKQEDHAYDEYGYVLMARHPEAETTRKDIPQDVHPGFLSNGQRRHRARTPEHEQEEELIELAAAGVSLGGRYGRRG